DPGSAAPRLPAVPVVRADDGRTGRAELAGGAAPRDQVEPRSEAARSGSARARPRSRAGAADVQAQLRHDLPGVSARLPAGDGDEGPARGGGGPRGGTRTRVCITL